MERVILGLSFLLLPLLISAQNIEGKVSDAKGRPITNAEVYIYKNNSHTHTDENGAYTLHNVLLGDSIRISHVSFQSHNQVVSSVFIESILHEKLTTLDEVIIVPELNAINVITEVDIQAQPVNSSQDVLQKVPGLFIGQHAGGGKAEQIFLRGFDVDHGTDIAISADGIPVNMVSHAHGQGYSDLHFIIPETIDKIDFGKGPYYGDKGDFNTAGYINFKTKEKIENSSVKLEVGQFNTQRIMALFEVLKTNTGNAYLATEYISTDGPFESPQNFNRLNIFGKYTGKISSRDKIGLIVSHFNSRWDASGQIPQRAVDSGEISRFGAIDDTEGGVTSRTNIVLNLDRQIDASSFINNQIYFSQYNFELYSNFTFFLEDSINGDQIRQKENRQLFGLTSTYNKVFEGEKISGVWRAGFALRSDWSGSNELSHTKNRKETLESIQLGDIQQSNYSVFTDIRLTRGKWTIIPALRVDHFNFHYSDLLSAEYQSRSVHKTIVCPKINVLYSHTKELQFYIKTGRGFHSNDTRVVVSEEGHEVIPAAYGSDIGFIWKPTSKVLINAAFWNLYMQQEFVYVGDAGIVEPSGRTNRKGLDLSMRYQPSGWIFINADVTYTDARSLDEDQGENYIPLAPNFTFNGGLIIKTRNGWYGGFQCRYLADRPANEDNSIIARGYTVCDANLGKQFKQLSVALQVQNVLNTEWNETQFATLSRLQHEVEPVEEIHFTPGTPFFAKIIVEYSF